MKMHPIAFVIGLGILLWGYLEPYQKYEVQKVGYNLFSDLAETVKPDPRKSLTQQQ